MFTLGCFMLLLTAGNLYTVYSESNVINFSNNSCGKYQSKRSRIVNGVEAESGEFPWIVSIKYKSSHTCSGVIVNKNWIVTAAHCFCSGNSLYTKNVFSIDVSFNGSRQYIKQNRRITRLFIHPEYECNRLENDIAMIEIENDLQLLLFDSACFSVNDKSEFWDLSSETGIAAGWGATNEDLSKGKIPLELQKVNIPILRNSVCQEWYTSQNKTITLMKSQLCAGYINGGKDTCWADSGGPLMVRHNEQVVVVGIVSTGIGCARPSLPGIYTRISSYIGWISKLVA